MNTPPRSFAAPPPSARRRRISLAFGGALLLALVAATTAIYVWALPAWLFKAAVAAAGLAWAGHVVWATRGDRAGRSTGGRLSGPR